MELLKKNEELRILLKNLHDLFLKQDELFLTMEKVMVIKSSVSCFLPFLSAYHVITDQSASNIFHEKTCHVYAFNTINK